LLPKGRPLPLFCPSPASLASCSASLSVRACDAVWALSGGKGFWHCCVAMFTYLNGLMQQVQALAISYWNATVMHMQALCVPEKQKYQVHLRLLSH
jgi:hypothetical protein